MNTPDQSTPEDLQLEQMLRQALPPLPDAGFSQRVVAALPPRTRTRPAQILRRRTTCILGAIAGLAFVVQQGVLTNGRLIETSDELAASLNATYSALTTPGIGIALGVTVVSLAYAFTAGKPRRRLLF